MPLTYLKEKGNMFPLKMERIPYLYKKDGNVLDSFKMDENKK